MKSSMTKGLHIEMIIGHAKIPCDDRETIINT